MPDHDSIPTSTPSPFEAAFHPGADSVLTPASEEELRDLIHDAGASERPVVPCGHGTHAYLGNPPPAGALRVSMRAFKSVLRYEPEDFTVGVQAGIPLAELRDVLSEHGQELAIDLPASPRGTLGGLIATARGGPRLGSHGPLRSMIIGARGLRGGIPPTFFKTGGMVVKNVAGYDVAKLLVGSLGTTGPLCEANFKLRSLPAARRAQVAAFDSPGPAWDFVLELRRRRLEPAYVCVLDGEASARAHAVVTGVPPASVCVAWSFEGNQSGVDWLVERSSEHASHYKPELVETLEKAPERQLWGFLVNFSEPMSGAERKKATADQSLPAGLALARVCVLPGAVPALWTQLSTAFTDGSLRPAMMADALTGITTLRWHGSSKDLASPLAAVRDILRAARGNGHLLYLPPDIRAEHSYQLVEDASRALADRVRKVFDPQGIFCPGRLY